MKLWWKRGLAGEQRGAFLVFTALAIWFLMMFVAFAVDFGNYYQHRARLQNAADAAALAGVARCADNSDNSTSETTIGKGRLVKIPTDFIKGENGEAAAFSSDSYTFTKLSAVPSEVHDQGTAYVQRNYRSDMEIKEDSVWSAPPISTSSTTTQTTEGGNTKIITTSTLTNQYCYQVNLEDTVTTFFARIFGVEKLPVKVSAMAMLDGTESVTVEELLPMVSGHINDIIPNYYWESIAKYVTNIYDTNGNLVGTTAAPDPKDPSKSSNAIYGKSNINYLVSDAKFDYTEIVWGARDNIIGYQDSADGICAVPITANNVDESNVITQVFRFENDQSVLWNNKEIIGLFLDRDNVVKMPEIDMKKYDEYSPHFDDEEITAYNKNVEKNGDKAKAQMKFGARDRFVEIYLDKIRGKYDQKAGKFPSLPKPIFTRLESEPVRIGDRGVTAVCGITIHVELNEGVFNDEKNYIKPFVFAYDGPDPNRGRDDAPWIAKENVGLDYKGDAKNDYELTVGRIEQRCEPLYKSYEKYRNNSNRRNQEPPPQMVPSSQKTPGPIVVEIPGGCVFYGVIWAPRSQVTIVGGGKIVGYIAARRVDDTRFSGPHTFVQSQEISLPTLAAYHPAGETRSDYFNYTRYYITDNYNMVYTEFVDHTRLQ